MLERGGAGQSTEAVVALQTDLRALGYLRGLIDGDFGGGTERAIQALQYDLLNNDGSSTQNDGDAPVAVKDYNQGRIANITGVYDQPTADCIAEMLADDAFPKLPKSDNPAAENARVVRLIETLPDAEVPIPFLTAICERESNLRQYVVLRPGDADNYVLVGLDTNNAAAPFAITSRGYGVGQYTLFHHPPQPAEVSGFILDVVQNISQAGRELLEKFKHFVNGDSSGTQADDRLKEVGNGPLRACKYPPDDDRYLKDCQACMREAGTTDIVMGETPWYAGSANVYETTQYYDEPRYDGVPVRAKIPCDWPYAARRYNGSGQNSYHYQAHILMLVLRGPEST